MENLSYCCKASVSHHDFTREWGGMSKKKMRESMEANMKNRVWFVCSKCNTPCRALDYIEYIAYRATLITKEVRQQILDGMHGGKNIGTVAKELNLTTEDVCGVINENLNTFNFETLNKQAK